MVSELEGGVNRSTTTLETAENGRPRTNGRKTHENGFQTAPPGHAPGFPGAWGIGPKFFGQSWNGTRESDFWAPGCPPEMALVHGGCASAHVFCASSGTQATAWRCHCSTEMIRTIRFLFTLFSLSQISSHARAPGRAVAAPPRGQTVPEVGSRVCACMSNATTGRVSCLPGAVCPRFVLAAVVATNRRCSDRLGRENSALSAPVAKPRKKLVAVEENASGGGSGGSGSRLGILTQPQQSRAASPSTRPTEIRPSRGPPPAPTAATPSSPNCSPDRAPAAGWASDWRLAARPRQTTANHGVRS